jgi:hypothetical protein
MSFSGCTFALVGSCSKRTPLKNATAAMTVSAIEAERGLNATPRDQGSV